MRPHVRFLDSESLDWVPIFKTGASRRTLNTDPADRSFTSMVKIPRGWLGPSGAHYHSSFEEAYIISGSLTLDGRDYLTPESYLYRPGFIVHGWDERSDEGSLIVIKRGGVSDIISVGPKLHDHEYVHTAVEDGRPHIVHLKTAEMGWTWTGDSAGRFSSKLLSADALTGSQARLINFPSGWRGQFTAAPGHDLECVVVRGGFELADGTLFRVGSYFYRPPGAADPPISAAPGGGLAIMWTERKAT